MKSPKCTSTSSFWTESLAEELLRFLTGRLKCPETAADLTHETYLRLHQSVKRNPPDNARALAYRIALNLAIDYQRKIKVRNRHNSDAEFDTVTETIPSTSPRPERILAGQQRLGLLQKALDELPPNCRTAFLLHGVEGLKYAEIAERMGISKSMVNRLLSRALAHCTQKLNE